MPSNVFRSLEAGDDPAFQTDHVDSVLAIIAGQKQVLELGAGLRSPLPAADLIAEKLAANVASSVVRGALIESPTSLCLDSLS